jgi:hypothetical protein
MKKILFAVPILFASTSAFAQTMTATPPAPTQDTTTAQPAPAAPTAQTPVAGTPSATTPSTSTTGPASAAQDGGTTGSAASVTNDAGQVAALVNTQFPRYDSDQSGTLSQPEFARWIGDLKKAEAQATGKASSAAEISTYAGNAFVSADKDQDKSVTKAELTTFLGG